MSEPYLIRTDCRHYRGEKPCRAGRPCAGCPEVSPVGLRICIVKLAAAGDVLRTTPLLRALRREHPDAWITWVTDRPAATLLAATVLIDELVVFGFEGLLPLGARHFDWLIVLDKEPRAAALGALISADRRTGFGLDRGGRLVALNPQSEYALRLGFDDELKFRRNTLTYPRIVFEQCGLRYEGEEYAFALDPRAGEAAFRRLADAGWQGGRPTVGLNTGCGEVFATKKWTEDGFVELATTLVNRLGVQVVLLGGPEEAERNRRIRERLSVAVVDVGTDNSLDVFAWLVAACRVLVTADTLALHLAIGLEKEVVLLMGPTSISEIELYGRGEIIAGGLPCSPCYRRTCAEDAPCMSGIAAGTVAEAVGRRLRAAPSDIPLA